MRRHIAKSVIAAIFVSSFLGSANAQQSGGYGGGTTGGFGGGITGSGGGSSFGSTSGFGPTMTGSGSTSGVGSSGSSANNSIFQPTSSYFGNLSYQRTPFGTDSYLRGPNAANGLGGWNGSSSTTGSRTGTSRTGVGATGLGGIGGLGGLGALGGLNRNRGMNLNQTNTQQNKVRTRISASNMRSEMGPAPVPATKFTARLSRLPNTEKFLSANISVQGRTAIIDAPNLAVADAERLGQLLMMEPGIDNFRIAGQTPDQRTVVPTSLGQ